MEVLRYLVFTQKQRDQRFQEVELASGGVKNVGWTKLQAANPDSSKEVSSASSPPNPETISAPGAQLISRMFRVVCCLLLMSAQRPGQADQGVWPAHDLLLSPSGARGL